ncbi:MAG TPA: SDR family NAD(P)-dependent oxidoreductase, partial [Thermoplasmata archaeon]|nr:SDR family NAD(P)-dependent oxidoreductase [Thermoplasmata archaeon]
MTTAIVTGASRGIGGATALELAARGMDVTVTYVRSREAAEDVVGLIRGTGRDAIAVRCDVAEPEDTVTVVDGTVDAFGGVDILVNNAGAYPRQRFGDLSVEDWRRVIEVNLSGAFYMTRACLPHLREAGWGRIVNVSSVLAHMGSS